MKLALVTIALVTGPCASKERTTTETAKQPTAIAKTEKPAAKADKGYIGVVMIEGIDVTAPVPTKVDKLLVTMGDVVKAKQVVVRLDPKRLQQDLDLANANAASAATAARGAEAQYRTDAKALKEGLVAAAVVQSSKATWDTLRAQASSEYTKVNVLRAQLKDLTITAPIDGVVARTFVEDGATVEAKQPLLRVNSSGKPYVKFAVPADEAKKVAVGAAIEISVDNREIPVAGTIAQIAPDVDGITHMKIVRAELVDPPKDLEVGLKCHVHLKAVAAAPPKKT